MFLFLNSCHTVKTPWKSFKVMVSSTFVTASLIFSMSQNDWYWDSFPVWGTIEYYRVQGLDCRESGGQFCWSSTITLLSKSVFPSFRHWESREQNCRNLGMFRSLWIILCIVATSTPNFMLIVSWDTNIFIQKISPPASML